MDKGYRLYRLGDYLRAFELFSAADDIMRVPTTSVELAKAQSKLGRLVEALETLARVRGYPEAPGQPWQYQRARKEAKALEAELLQRIPTLEIALAPLPTGTTATVAIDGKALAPERALVPNKLNPGQHRVTIHAPGMIPHEQNVVLQERQRRRLDVQLQPVRKAPPQATAPPAAVGPSAVEPADARAAISPLAWAAFGVGAAGLVVGTVAGAIAVSQDSALEDDCPNELCPEAKKPDFDRMVATANVSTAGFVVAGVGATVGVILLLTSDTATDESAESAVAIQPVLGFGTAALIGRF